MAKIKKAPSAKPKFVKLIIPVLFAGLIYIIQADIFIPLEVKNGEILVSRYLQIEEEYDHPRLKLLREREKLDEVMSLGKTQFEKLVLLRGWTHKQWVGGSNFFYPPWDAVEILDLARKYGNRGFCAQYAIVFLQACLSVGIPARYVDLPGHFVVGVWSDDYNKWVIMDPASDIHYERSGAPLRGRDLCDAYWNDNCGDIYKVDSSGKKTKIKKDDIAMYRMYSIVLRNNHISVPMRIARNGKEETLRIRANYRDYPMVGRDSIGFEAGFLSWDQPGAKEKFLDKLSTNDPDDFRYVFNQTLMIWKRKKDILKIKLFKENSPHFKTFLARGNNGYYTEVKELVFFELSTGINEFYARVKTSYGWLGPESRIKVFYKPNLIAKIFKKS